MVKKLGSLVLDSEMDEVLKFKEKIEIISTVYDSNTNEQFEKRESVEERMHIEHVRRLKAVLPPRPTVNLEFKNFGAKKMRISFTQFVCSEVNSSLIK